MLRMTADLPALAQRLALHYDARSYRRVIAGKEVILHCHHYNARLQRTIESADIVDGRRMLVAAAERVFSEHIAGALRPGDDAATRWAAAELLYRHLGFGRLDLSRVHEGVAEAPTSHFVEGFLAALGRPDRKVCSFSEGYIQGAVRAVTGEWVEAREVECMAQGAEACRFVITRGRADVPLPPARRPIDFTPRADGSYLRSPNIDEQKILEALVAMPIAGGDDGLVPAFGVYLACMPAEFYNQICLEFVDEMRRRGRGPAGEQLLIAAGEVCGMNTFRGIMGSVEWDGLVAPMLRAPGDELFALIAISNALGWGNWHVTAFSPGESLGLEALCGYEALGAREALGVSAAPRCYMLTGVAAGIMGLLYGEGSIEERFGGFSAVERACIGCGAPACSFHVERVG